jgi:hypothetical protein
LRERFGAGVRFKPLLIIWTAYFASIGEHKSLVIKSLVVSALTGLCGASILTGLLGTCALLKCFFAEVIVLLSSATSLTDSTELELRMRGNLGFFAS